MNPPRGPLLIGGVGGSGTRVIARILAQAGVFIGAQRTAAEDSVPIMKYYVSWLRPYIAACGALPDSVAQLAANDFWRAIADHRHGIGQPDDPWAVKSPRSLLMLPYWHAVFPDLRFFHIICSGLNMAYSANTYQLDAFQDLVLAPADLELPKPFRTMAYWRTVTRQTADFGESFLGKRYLALRFEDLCRDPKAEFEKMANFTGLPIDSERVVSLVDPPASIGRWRSAAPEEIRSLVEIGRTGLDRFGYDYPGRRDAQATA